MYNKGEKDQPNVSFVAGTFVNADYYNLQYTCMSLQYQRMFIEKNHIISYKKLLEVHRFKVLKTNK